LARPTGGGGGGGGGAAAAAAAVGGAQTRKPGGSVARWVELYIPTRSACAASVAITW